MKPWLKKQWCIPEVSAEFVAPMEDVLEGYAEPYDPTRPKVNFDETTKQLIKETRLPLPAEPGRPQRYDYEYERNGTRNLFLFVEPQTGRRHVQVTEQRTKIDFAHAMQWLVDEGYPEATVIRVVLDNLNTHKIASLYEAFEPAEARRIARKLEFHFTPKHGSWLNMAEIESSGLYSNNASTVVSPTKPRSSEKSRPGNISAMQSKRLLIGAFLSPMRARNSNVSIHHFQRDKVLEGSCRDGGGTDGESQERRPACRTSLPQDNQKQGLGPNLRRRHAIQERRCARRGPKGGGKTGALSPFPQPATGADAPCSGDFTGE